VRLLVMEARITATCEEACVAVCLRLCASLPRPSGLFAARLACFEYSPAKAWWMSPSPVSLSALLTPWTVRYGVSLKHTAIASANRAPGTSYQYLSVIVASRILPTANSQLFREASAGRPQHGYRKLVRTP
jgi:hypothetical protein